MGQRPDLRELAPEFTVYEKYLCYQTYDVTGLLKEGENTLELYVGDGWYCGPKTQPAGPGRRPVHAVLFQLRLEIKAEQQKPSAPTNRYRRPRGLSAPQTFLPGSCMTPGRSLCQKSR